MTEQLTTKFMMSLYNMGIDSETSKLLMYLTESLGYSPSLKPERTIGKNGINSVGKPMKNTSKCIDLYRGKDGKGSICKSISSSEVEMDLMDCEGESLPMSLTTSVNESTGVEPIRSFEASIFLWDERVAKLSGLIRTYGRIYYATLELQNKDGEVIGESEVRETPLKSLLDEATLLSKFGRHK